MYHRSRMLTGVYCGAMSWLFGGANAAGHLPRRTHFGLLFKDGALVYAQERMADSDCTVLCCDQAALCLFANCCGFATLGTSGRLLGHDLGS